MNVSGRTVFNCENFLNPRYCDQDVMRIFLLKSKNEGEAVNYIRQSEYDRADEACANCKNFKLKPSSGN